MTISFMLDAIIRYAFLYIQKKKKKIGKKHIRIYN